MKILNFGSCNIDYVYTLDHIVNVGETETSIGFEVFPGGKGLNQSVAISKAGARIYHAGCIGNDGALLTEVFEKNNIDTTYLRCVDVKNGHAIIQLNKNGENSIFCYPGSNEMITEKFVDEVLANFEQGDIVLLQNEINNVNYIVKEAYRKGMCVILNPSPINEKISEIDFNQLSYLIMNEVEAEAITGHSSYDESLSIIREQYPKLKIILTLGSKGSIYADEDNEIYQPSFKTEAVDTTAAGDTFTGYFVAELLNEESYSRILKIASAAAAISVSRKGASPSIPERSEVLSSIGNMRENSPRGKNDVIIRKTEAYIDENLKNANLEELAKILGYSSVYTGSLVKKLFGESFLMLVQTKKCKKAAELLRDTDLPIGEIIDGLGYENAGFFRRVFKKTYGKTLLEFRKNEENKFREQDKGL